MLNILVNNVITRQQQQIMKIQNIYVINFIYMQQKQVILILKCKDKDRLTKNAELDPQGQNAIGSRDVNQVKSKHEGIKCPCQECDPIYATLEHSQDQPIKFFDSLN